MIWLSLFYDNDDIDSAKARGTSLTHTPSKTRYVKIQCPGVGHRDIEIEIVANGVVVKIMRRKSPGMCELSWTKKFQFSTAEGNFEFKEEEVRLELGILLLPFQSYTPRPRVFRLPQHRHHDFTLEAQLSDPPCSEIVSSSVKEDSPSWVLAASNCSSAPSEEPVSCYSPQTTPQCSLVAAMEEFLPEEQEEAAPIEGLTLEGRSLVDPLTVAGLQDLSDITVEQPSQRSPSSLPTESSRTGPLSGLPTESSRSHSCDRSSRSAPSEASQLEQ